VMSEVLPTPSSPTTQMCTVLGPPRAAIVPFVGGGSVGRVLGGAPTGGGGAG
jgi:hypothetical protein